MSRSANKRKKRRSVRKRANASGVNLAALATLANARAPAQNAIPLPVTPGAHTARRAHPRGRRWTTSAASAVTDVAAASRFAVAARHHVRDHAIAIVAHADAIPDTVHAGTAHVGPTRAGAALATTTNASAHHAVGTGTLRRLTLPTRTSPRAPLLRQLMNPALTPHRTPRLSHRLNPRSRAIH